MAHSATITGLAADLITSFAGQSVTNDSRKFRRTKDAVARGLRAQQWTRTNQFDVQESYEGLVEKFFVLNRSDLAEALEVRLKEIERTPGRWTPEILSLFLHLSDNAVEKASVENLELLKPPEPPPSLTWAEIIADDPLDEEGVWDDIDYAAESSEEERQPKRKRAATTREPSPPTTEEDEEDDFVAVAETFLLPSRPSTLEEVSESQFWRKEKDKTEPTEKDIKQSPGGRQTSQITELQAIRETLFMLAGLPTSLYRLDKKTAHVDCNDRFILTHAMIPTWKNQLRELASIGDGLLELRSWTSGRQSVALLQTFQAAVVEEIGQFDKYLAQLQGCYLVSLTAVMVKVQQRAELLLRLKDLIMTASQSDGPFTFIEALYNQINLSQVVNEPCLFQTLGRIFFQCLQTYLKPIREWMEQGELGLDDQIFFVGVADKSSEAASLWHDQYVLRHDSGGELHAPSFLHPAAKKIFNSGKSVVFLKELERHDIAASSIETEPCLDLEAVCGGVGVPLAPFSELFNLAFEDWIRSKYTLASTVLRQHLYSGLWQSLDALEFIYFSRDGSLMQSFADMVFEKLDRGRTGWNDRYLLTEIARSVYSVVPSVNADRLVVRPVATKQKGRTVKALGSIAVDYILPWSILNVVQRSSTPTYQRISTLLLQVYRARYLLRSTQLWHSGTPQHAQAQYYLRHRLLWFADMLHGYLTETVLWTATTALRKALADAEDIDVMAALHANHVHLLDRQCLLTPQLRPILQAVLALLDLSVFFTDALAALSGEGSLNVHARRETTPRSGGGGGGGGSDSGTRRRPAGSGEDTDEDTDEDENEAEDGDEDADAGKERARRATSSESAEAARPESLAQMRAQFGQLLGFVVAGLRGVSRAGGERAWEMLAERLEWGVSVMTLLAPHTDQKVFVSVECSVSHGY
ncbi:uncharacterized protein K452DRAFT_327592 [Aplosporella prunicola CBS 121167]|uniref:Spindle pole body component n=1 Tax=Aplosporella prunicola CBS 121167 TaxID=1176127 RepID=A0A6A6BA34_9PEZI|nr:uncharacterized protein K452DRAFT_327592 [Aplosporella prunicola CBS 121167]KAF2140165.1 hypothetical protein K452DRAFT_327592 [Aplosporella prunicola CBS 121167]